MDLVNLDVGTAALTGLMGYLVVFTGLILLMVVIMIMGKVFVAKANKASSPQSEAVVNQSSDPAKGTAGELKLYDTDPKDAAMIMAIVADSLGKPLNELRFKSIKEIK